MYGSNWYSMTLTIRVHKDEIEEAMNAAGAQMPNDWVSWVENQETNITQEAVEIWNEKLEEYIQSDLEMGELQEKPECACDGDGWILSVQGHILACTECAMFSSALEAAVESEQDFIYIQATRTCMLNNKEIEAQKQERQMEIASIRCS